jgi:hypothetical protein
VRHLQVWQRAGVLKCNPDSPQLPLRQAALREGKTLYMAVPRLRQERCFIELDPQRLGRRAAAAATIRGAFGYRRPVAIDELRPIDLVICGSVAVSCWGARVGKGGGYSATWSMSSPLPPPDSPATSPSTISSRRRRLRRRACGKPASQRPRARPSTEPARRPAAIG